MKIIENYDELSTEEIGLDAKKIIYKQSRDLKHLDKILELIPPHGKSVWIDSNGTDISENIIAFEHHKWKGIFETDAIKYYKDFYSNTLHNAVKKYITPSSIVMYNSFELKYINENELVKILNFLIDCYQSKLIIHVDTIFIDFNKLKYSVDYIIKKVENNIKKKSNIHKLDNLEYIFEIN